MAARGLAGALVLLQGAAGQASAGNDGAARFHETIQPLLQQYCYDCHGDGLSKGGVAFDAFKSDTEVLQNRQLWWRVLKNVRAHLMPPARKPRPTVEEQQQLAKWIKTAVFGIDPQHPDPGRVTLRRLNRVEYRNTIHDLMGVDYNTTEEFPPDDTGYGFDDIGDVLSVSPLLLEKYLRAARTIVATAVPRAAKVMRERTLPGAEFRAAEGGIRGDRLSFYQPAKVSHDFDAQWPGSYRLRLELAVRGDFELDPGRCQVVFKVDGQERWRREFAWADHRKFQAELEAQWPAGEQALSFELQPLTPPDQRRSGVDFRIVAVHVQGPREEQYWAPTKNYARFFPRSQPPSLPAERRQYAREILARFARRAYRRPVDDRTLDRLTALAEAVYSEPAQTFESGVAQAMVAVLASPRFLFRLEENEPAGTDGQFPLVDEYSLASRLSYFLWSTMPDEELLQLAGRGQLRQNLPTQVKRLLADPRADALVRNFAGQWLQLRDVDTVPINVRVVLGRRVRDPELDPGLRRAMRQETELFVGRIFREDRSVLELLDSDYTYLNEKLAQHYGIADVRGPEMRRVTLPVDSPRGGLLTQASILMVTSNPTRTSPVKRGLFILDNILGVPPPPPPAAVPALEDSKKAFTDHEPTLRQMLELHRNKPLCSSCHSRMDPLGLALENFNALGIWRDKERDQPIDAAGKLVTGESFQGIRDLKRILKEDHRQDFYRCLTEKLLTYAVGRGLDYYDVETVDQIVDRLMQADGRSSALLLGVIESAPFLRRRQTSTVLTAAVTPHDPSSTPRFR